MVVKGEILGFHQLGSLPLLFLLGDVQNKINLVVPDFRGGKADRTNMQLEEVAKNTLQDRMEQVMTPNVFLSEQLQIAKLKIVEPYRANVDNMRALDQSLQMSFHNEGASRFLVVGWKYH